MVKSKKPKIVLMHEVMYRGKRPNSSRGFAFKKWRTAKQIREQSKEFNKEIKEGRSYTNITIEKTGKKRKARVQGALVTLL